MLCVFAVLSGSLVSAGPGHAEAPAPVVLVWGEYLAAANTSEAPGTRNYLENIGRALEAVGLAYAETKDSEVEKGALRGHKFAIFPYNSNLSDVEREEIRRFVAGGGKLWASFTRDPALNELLGVKVGQSVAPKYEGYYSFMLFRGPAPAGVPEGVVTGSWYGHEITPLPETQVIAHWGDGDQQDTGMPALTINENGYYHGHVMLGGDAALLSLLDAMLEDAAILRNRSSRQRPAIESAEGVGHLLDTNILQMGRAVLQILQFDARHAGDALLDVLGTHHRPRFRVR